MQVVRVDPMEGEAATSTSAPAPERPGRCRRATGPTIAW
jgi:hypothetical protein